MRGIKETRRLQEKKRHFEARVAAAGKLLDEIGPELKGELRRICLKLGIDDILKGKRKFEEAQNTPLTPEERRLFGAWYGTLYAEALDSYELRWIESLLSPAPRGRTPGSPNKQPKPLDPTIAAALEHRKTKEGSKLSLIKLAHKFAPTKTFQDKKRWLYRLKKAIGSSFRPQ